MEIRHDDATRHCTYFDKYGHTTGLCLSCRAAKDTTSKKLLFLIVHQCYSAPAYVQPLPEVDTATPADTVAKCDDDGDASEDNDEDAIGDDADDNENNNDDDHKADNEDASAQSPPHSIPPLPQIPQLPNHDF